MNKRIFISGASGYIGAPLTQRLVSQGHTVHVLLRGTKALPWASHERIKVFYGDICNYDDVARAMHLCQEAYHLAAFARVWARDTTEYFKQNVHATEQVLRAAREVGLGRTVCTSTGGIFGPSFQGAIAEGYARKVDFFNEYESSKCVAELLIKNWAIQGQDIVSVAPTRVYGPSAGGKLQSVNLMIDMYLRGKWRFIPGDGSKVGNYVLVDDVVEGHLLAMEKGRSGHTYLLAGENHDYLSLFRLLAQVSGRHHRMVFMPHWVQGLFAHWQLWRGYLGMEPSVTPKWTAKGRYDFEVSNQKACEELGLKITPLAQGIEKTVGWLKADR
ncbi:MAG: NAD-dependent epimerase/dehydratase family protein [Bacteroidetes bacterium]|jgi:farnesol dehydrogenase|nr:NAD-dependent epimerase/dehydratase family protein [Bacteroidota bacterium]